MSFPYCKHFPFKLSLKKKKKKKAEGTGKKKGKKPLSFLSSKATQIWSFWRMAQDKNSTSVCFLWLNNLLVCQIARRREEREALVAAKCSEIVLPPSSLLLGAPEAYKGMDSLDGRQSWGLAVQNRREMGIGWETLRSSQRIGEPPNWDDLGCLSLTPTPRIPCLPFRDIATFKTTLLLHDILNIRNHNIE